MYRFQNDNHIHIHEMPMVHGVKQIGNCGMDSTSNMYRVYTHPEPSIPNACSELDLQFRSFYIG